MEKLLLRTSSAVSEIEDHLKETLSAGTPIEFYLTQHILILLCAEMQQEIHRIVALRVSVLGDEVLKNYVSSTSSKILRSVMKSDIAGFVKMFGDDPKLKFDSLINDNEVTVYNQAVTERHKTAHSHGAQITFKELKGAIQVAKKILKAVEESISH